MALSRMLTFFLNSSLSILIIVLTIVPDIKPVFKKTSGTDKEIYRPVSILSTSPKFMEDVFINNFVIILM